jgi:hypothetical protein
VSDADSARQTVVKELEQFHTTNADRLTKATTRRDTSTSELATLKAARACGSDEKAGRDLLTHPCSLADSVFAVTSEFDADHRRALIPL